MVSKCLAGLAPRLYTGSSAKSVLNLQNLQVWSNFPGVKHEDCMKSIKMFTEKVMPHFKDDLNTEVKKVS